MQPTVFITELITNTLGKLGLEGDVRLEHPSDFSHGDYSCNIAMVLAKQVGKNPRELADEIVANFDDHEYVEKVEVAGPGFINFYLAYTFFNTIAQTAREKGDVWGHGDSLQGKNILIEKSAPNLFKPFHIGHLVNISIGEALSRLYRATGATVTDVAYPSDISLGVAKAVWALMQKELSEPLTVHDLGKAYVEGTQAYDEDESAKESIVTINKKINAHEAGVEYDLYQKGREVNLQYFKDVTKWLGSEFSDTFFESEAGTVGKDIVQSHVGDVFTKSQGAVVFEGEKYGLHTRVFLTSLGLPVYETKDIGLMKLKFEKYKPDVSLVITDIEQKQYFEVVKKAAELIQPEWAERSQYWQHGRMRFEGGKISSRYGNVPLAEDVVIQVADVVQQRVQERVDAMKVDEVSQQVGLGAFKYAVLRVSPEKNITFDFEQSLSVEGDSGPYIQYTHARAQAVIQKADEAGVTPTIDAMEEKNDVTRMLARFPEVVERAAQEYAPHHVTLYITELASAFNTWYANDKFLDGTDAAAHKIAVTEAVATTLKNGLWLLGIEAPERM